MARRSTSDDLAPVSDTRTALIQAAERLFAEHGVEGVSLREITRAAGQRNTSALQYHFTNRDGLLREILTRHVRGIGASRTVLLDRYEQSGQEDLRPLASALILPLIAKLSDVDGGHAYLLIADELLGRITRTLNEDPIALLVLRDPDRSVLRWTDLVTPLLPPEAVGHPLHRRFAAVRLVYLELSRRAKHSPHQDHTLFTQNLTDLITAVLATPVSEETKQALARRR